MRLTGKKDKNRIYKNIMRCKDYCVPFWLWYYRAFDEVKHLEKLREQVEGVTDENGKCAGFIRSQLKLNICTFIAF